MKMRWQDRQKIGGMLVELGWTRNPRKGRHFSARNTYEKGQLHVFLWEYRDIAVQVVVSREGTDTYVSAPPLCVVGPFAGRGWHQRVVDDLEKIAVKET